MGGHLLPTGLLFVLEKSLQDASLLAGLTSQTPGEKLSNHYVNILLGKTFWIFSHHISYVSLSYVELFNLLYGKIRYVSFTS